MPALLKSTSARIVTVSSTAYQSGELNFDDLQHARKYKPYGAYSDSKLANLLFMLKLDEAFEIAGLNALSVGADPGLAKTNLDSAGPRFIQAALGRTRRAGGQAGWAVGRAGCGTPALCGYRTRRRGR